MLILPGWRQGACNSVSPHSRQGKPAAARLLPGNLRNLELNRSEFA